MINSLNQRTEPINSERLLNHYSHSRMSGRRRRVASVGLTATVVN